MEWKHTLNDFEDFLKLEKGLSSNSIGAYLSDVRKLVQFLEMQQIPGGPDQMVHDHLHRFLV
ncbi:MAG: site-specific integrase, partial [Bacteroidales bacterium]